MALLVRRVLHREGDPQHLFFPPRKRKLPRDLPLLSCLSAAGNLHVLHRDVLVPGERNLVEDGERHRFFPEVLHRDLVPEPHPLHLREDPAPLPFCGAPRHATFAFCSGRARRNVFLSPLPPSACLPSRVASSEANLLAGGGRAASSFASSAGPPRTTAP